VIPGNVLEETYIERPDLKPLLDWETGRKSEPAYMDMNIHAVCHESEPRIVLYQHDDGDPLNPRGLLIAYAEQSVKPVVSDFDAFLVASKGMKYQELAEDQAELVKWMLEAVQGIFQGQAMCPTDETWTTRWLIFLKSENVRGFHPTPPKYGYGDPTSSKLIADVIAQTSACGAVRHGAECFNFYFPQELDDEYLIVWQDYPEKPWKYVNEEELRKFLIARIAEGFTFPLNPVWPLRDPGWWEVLQALRNQKEAQENLLAWYPPASGILDKIKEIHDAYPLGLQNDDLCRHQGTLGYKDRPGATAKSFELDDRMENLVSVGWNNIDNSQRISTTRHPDGHWGGMHKLARNRAKTRKSMVSMANLSPGLWTTWLKVNIKLVSGGTGLAESSDAISSPSGSEATPKTSKTSKTSSKASSAKSSSSKTSCCGLLGTGKRSRTQP
jgi:hypothetical protein